MAEQGFTLISPHFENDYIPRRHTCEGMDEPPDLYWLHPPEGTASFALIMVDLDADKGAPVTHWMLFDIPATVSRLESRATRPAGVPGRNDFQTDGYRGPCPPPKHGEHRYRFVLYALDVESLGLGRGVRREALERAFERHILGWTELTARFGRGRLQP